MNCRGSSPLISIVDAVPTSVMPIISTLVIIFELFFPIWVLFVGELRFGRTVLGMLAMCFHTSLGLFMGDYFYFTPLALLYVGLLDWSSFFKKDQSREGKKEREKKKDKDKDKAKKKKKTAKNLIDTKKNLINDSDSKNNHSLFPFWTFLLCWLPWTYFSSPGRGVYPYQTYPGK